MAVVVVATVVVLPLVFVLADELVLVRPVRRSIDKKMDSVRCMSALLYIVGVRGSAVNGITSETFRIQPQWAPETTVRT